MILQWLFCAELETFYFKMQIQLEKLGPSFEKSFNSKSLPPSFENRILQVMFYAELETFVLKCKFNSKSLPPPLSKG